MLNIRNTSDTFLHTVYQYTIEKLNPRGVLINRLCRTQAFTALL